MKPVDNQITALLNKRLADLENHYNADILAYFGPIIDGNENDLLRIVEDLATDQNKKDRICVVLTTNGGSAIAVERYVNIIRHHYNHVTFIVPDYAYSAGTIFCMSGDDIHMDYYSVLGPIDPQVPNKEGKWVAALGYLDKVNEMLAKAAAGTLTQAEFIILQNIDLAELRGYEQAKELTIDLLKNWLVNYKFKNWNTHRTNHTKLGQAVTIQEKEERAEEIADMLSDNNTWKSHSRPININTLTNKIRLEIEDYSSSPDRRGLIRSYYELLSDYVVQKGYTIFVHTRKQI